MLCSMDPNAHGQWARPSLRTFILKELNAVECQGLDHEISVGGGGLSTLNVQHLNYNAV